MKDDPYSPPRADLTKEERSIDVAAEPKEQQALWREAYKLFAQDDYYDRVWRKLIRGESADTSFNLWAFLLGMIWCFHRKLYLLGIMVLIAEVAVSVLTGVVAVLLVGSDAELNSLRLWNILTTFLCIRTPLGIFANRRYFGKATSTIVSAVNGGGTDGEIRQFIGASGGTSAAGTIVAIAISIAIRIVESSIE